mmetsp:Transcript_10637/g.17876  ORF Transcript_10637/g.17876 Transcript_10637/m.17876 type:complete len:194 (+) Transcript_10637:760-1341(+)
MVEISTVSMRDMFIAAYDTDSPESLLIEIADETKAQEILTQFGNQYESLANCLQVINKRLVLLNPKYQTISQQLTNPTNSPPHISQSLEQGVNDYGYGVNKEEQQHMNEDQVNEEDLKKITEADVSKNEEGGKTDQHGSQLQMISPNQDVNPVNSQLTSNVVDLRGTQTGITPSVENEVKEHMHRSQLNQNKD